MNETLNFYDKNAESFANGTADIEFSEMQDMFLAELKEGASILDFGCGSGRDTRYFLQKGYRVTALDGSVELCRIAEEKTGIPVILMDFNDFNAQDQYDGISIPPRAITCRGGMYILKSYQGWNTCPIS